MKTISRRHFAFLLSGTAAAAAAAALPARADDGGRSLRAGKVFSMTNSPAGNELLVFGRTEEGFAEIERASTQGLGSGSGLGSQGAVTVSHDGRHVFVVNAGSHTVSVFELRGRSLRLVAVADSGGLTPTSITEHQGLVYVLNAGGAGNVAGLRFAHGELQPIAGGERPLSAAGGTAPAQVGFGLDGDVLVVTERVTNRIVSWPVQRDGRLGPPAVTPSAGLTPFGFSFDRRDHLLVSEAAAGAALGSSACSYAFDERHPSAPALVSGTVSTHQTAACWLVVTPNGRYAYTGNAGSSSVSSFAVARNGALTLLLPAAGLTGPNAGATDLGMARDGRSLYVLAGRAAQVVAFEIAADGSLTPAGSAALPAGSIGLAAN